MKTKAFSKLIILSMLAMMVMAGCSGSKGSTGSTGATGATGQQGPTGIEPVITSITPMASVNTVVTIAGSNFSATQGSGKVYMNGVDAGTAISWTSTQITIMPPASLTAGNGLTETVVTNVTVNQLASNAVAFDLVPSGTVHPVKTMFRPQAITSTPSNMLYATDLYGNITQIDQNGVAQVIATDPLLPVGITFTNNVLYVADTTADGSGNYWINIVNPKNGTVTPWRLQTVAPLMLTNDDAGDLYVTYPADGSVYEYTINGSSSHPTNLHSSSLTSPQGIAYVNGYLYIAANNAIAQYNITSHALNPTWAPAICASGYATGVVYQQSQNVLLVSCPNNNTISKVTMAGAVNQGFITSNGNYPLGMTFDANGNLYIANSQDIVVTKVTFTNAGAPNTITWFAAGPLGALGNMGTDNAGNVYVTGILHNLVVKLTPDNKTSIYASNDTLNGYAIGCTFSPNGVMLIADYLNNKIDTVPVGGGTITPWIDTTALGSPYDVAVDGSGNVFVNIGTNIIAKYDASGAQVSPSFVSGLNTFLQILAQGNTLTIPDFGAINLQSASSAGSGPVAPTVIMNGIGLLAVAPAPSGQFYGTDGSMIWLINPATSSASYVAIVNAAFQIATMADGSIFTSDSQ
ncbi:MAG: IPT/TIG domain-containing protein [Deltaproteobacteria bacterium]|nr:IPT/TIG domain-containing protein [Deltaproteobacteria bacterium]